MTNGDQIRRSNEALAKFISEVTEKCIVGKCEECKLYKWCDDTEVTFFENVMTYLEQPLPKTYTEEAK